MTPIKFPEQNAGYGESQPEYLSLPVHRSGDDCGMVTSCWELSWRERLELLLTGRLWIRQMTMHKLLQPIKPMVYKPDFIGESMEASKE